MSAETPAAPGQNDEHYLQVFRRNFRTWRGDRPFWAGLFVLLGGFPIAYFPYANLQLGHLTLTLGTPAGSSSLIIGVLLVVLGISLWFQKHVRTFAGVAAILLALVSIPLSNLGGFLVGFLFAMIGGAMAVSWAPGERVEEQAASAAPLSKATAPDPLIEATAPDPLIEATAPDPLIEATAPDPLIEAPDPFGKGEAPESVDSAAAEPAAANGVGEPNDLSGTSPTNGANGRHSAG